MKCADGIQASKWHKVKDNKHIHIKCLQKEKAVDQRVRYSKMVIKNVFIEKLREKPIDKITVSEICSEAQINRATFYKYYENPYDLLDKLEWELIDNLEQKLVNQGVSEFTEVIRTVLTEIKANYDIYNLLISDSVDIEFRDRIISHCYDYNIKSINKIFATVSEEKRDWIYYFIAEGCNGILTRWLKSGMAMPIDEVIDFTRNIVTGICVGYNKNTLK